MSKYLNPFTSQRHPISSPKKSVWSTHFSANISATPLNMPGKAPLHTLYPIRMTTNHMVIHTCMKPVCSPLISSSSGMSTGLKRPSLKP